MEKRERLSVFSFVFANPLNPLLKLMPWCSNRADAFTWGNPLITLLPGKLAEWFSQVYLSWRERKIINTLHWMQIAPTALISFSISINVIALQACYGFTTSWVINFCERHIRHLIMSFINKCHPRYLLGAVNKLNVHLSALCKSLLTLHRIFPSVCLPAKITAEITAENKRDWTRC